MHQPRYYGHELVESFGTGRPLKEPLVKENDDNDDVTRETKALIVRMVEFDKRPVMENVKRYLKRVTGKYIALAIVVSVWDVIRGRTCIGTAVGYCASTFQDNRGKESQPRQKVKYQNLNLQLEQCKPDLASSNHDDVLTIL